MKRKNGQTARPPLFLVPRVNEGKEQPHCGSCSLCLSAIHVDFLFPEARPELRMFASGQRRARTTVPELSVTAAPPLTFVVATLIMKMESG